MPSAMNVEILPSELAQIVDSVFEAMMGLEASACGSQWFGGEDRINAAVHLTGDWNGVVLVECNGEQACRFAGRFLSIDPPETVDDVVRDVLGELVHRPDNALYYCDFRLLLVLCRESLPLFRSNLL